MLLFFCLAFAITWVLQTPAVLARYGVIDQPVEALLPLAMLGVFGPMVAAMVASRREARRQNGEDAIRNLVRPLGQWRVHPVWFLVALLLPGAVLTLAMSVYIAAGGEGALLYLPDGSRMLAAVLIAIGEEIGWRGFALPRLQARHGPVRASLVLGVLWALWHIPMLAGVGVGVSAIPALLLYFVSGTFVFTWLYNRSHGSLLLMVLLHVGAHLNNSHLALPSNAAPVLVHAVGLTVLVAILLMVDPSRWRRQPPP